MCGIKQAIAGEREYFTVYGTKQRSRIAFLKVRASGAPDKKAVAGKRHTAAVEHIGHAGFGVPRSMARLEHIAAKPDGLPVTEIEIGARRTASRGHGDMAAGTLAVQTRAGDVIRVNMGIKRHGQVQSQFGSQRLIPPDLLKNRVDQHRLSALSPAKEVGVGRGHWVKKLPEDQRDSTLM